MKTPWRGALALNHVYAVDALQAMRELPDKCLAGIITDPPYARESLYLYDAVLREAGRLLKRGGSLLMILPQYAMVELGRMTYPPMTWRWVLTMPLDRHARMAGFRLYVETKLVGWWTKGPLVIRRLFIPDSAPASRAEKGLHPWQQSVAWAEYCLRFIDRPGPVLDPYIGTGTVGVACKLAKRPWLGFELDAARAEAANARVASCNS